MSRRSRRKKETGDAMSSAVDSPARTSAVAATKMGSMVNSPVYGENTRGSFAWFDHDSSSWKTWQTSFTEGWETFSATWPEWGSMRNGVCFPLRPLVSRRDALAFSLLPTLTVGDATGARNGTCSTRTHSDGLTLTDWVWLNVQPQYVPPEFAEWITGFPEGWTDCESAPAVTPSSHKSPNGSDDD